MNGEDELGYLSGGFPGGTVVKNTPEMEETRVQSLGQEDPLEEDTAIHSSFLCLENPMNRGVQQATVSGFAKSGTQLSH